MGGEGFCWGFCRIGGVKHAFSNLRADTQRGSPVTPGSNAANRSTGYIFDEKQC